MTTPKRRKARERIVQKANQFKVRFHLGRSYQPVLFGMRHIQQAVCVARHHQLVKPEVLEAAGFNPRRAR